MKYNLLALICFAVFFSSKAQVESSQPGAWWMYFFNHNLEDSRFGFQGDVQYRDWQGLGDMEQLLLRAGATYRPQNTTVKLTLGYAHITSGQFGESNNTTTESRVYQEAVMPNKIGNRVYITHRFRYEQRFVENQDFRTRYRYNLFVNIPLNKKELAQKTYYLALYNEVFVNGQKETGTNSTVELFDRNRTYLGLGYILNPKVKFQLGWMNQKTDAWGKGQFQLSFHQNF